MSLCHLARLHICHLTGHSTTLKRWLLEVLYCLLFTYITLLTLNWPCYHTSSFVACKTLQIFTQNNYVVCDFQEPYVNQSAFSVPDKFSLERTYITFRTMGLRHMAVVDENNHVIGVITRKDLMGFNMEEKLTMKISRTQSQEDLMLILED